MKEHSNVLKKLLDNFIVPRFDDIIRYGLSFDENKLDILFLMEGTDEEEENEIVQECKNLLKYYTISDIEIRYRFTTDGIYFYDYL